MNYVPIILFVLVIAGLVIMSGRARRKRSAEQAARVERIAVGTDVMTTSGLHGTVVSRNDDDTVQLSIAPGVEVKWELAALRDLVALPRQFRSAHPVDERQTSLDDQNVDLKKGDAGRGVDPV
ncbi:MAG: preprotein translocase subunit YajC [Jatrophihabitans sp.]